MAVHAESVLCHDDVLAAVVGRDPVQAERRHAVDLSHPDAIAFHQLLALIELKGIPSVIHSGRSEKKNRGA